MVLKRPKPGLDPVHIPAILEGMRQAVRFRDGLSAQGRQEIDEIAAWPVTMVMEHGQEVGCLLPLIPPAFFMNIPAKGNFPAKQEQRVIGYLAAPTKARNSVGYDSAEFHDDALRLHVLSKLAGAIELLHRHGMVFGDLNPNNEVFSFSPARVLLLDCDAVAHVSDTTRGSRQGHFPRWKPPEMNDTATSPKRLQDFDTDVYKLALAFARYIEGAAGATQRVAMPSPPPQILTSQLAALVARALDADPSVRPNAGDLRRAAENAVRAMVAPPIIERASLNKIVTLRGSDVIASWVIQASTPYEVEISTPEGQLTKVQAGTNTFAIRVASAGQIVLHVRTKYASVSHLIGEVDCYELPPFDAQTGALPTPRVPELPAFRPPEILRRHIEIPLPAWPSSLETITDGITALIRTAPSTDNLELSFINAIHASGVHALGANLVGSFPIPNTASSTSNFVEDLQQRFVNAIGAGSLPNAQALAYMRIIEQLTERVADLESQSP